MEESPISALTKAVLGLDEAMVRLGDEAKAAAGDIVRTADGLAQELENDINVLLYQLVEELNRKVEEEGDRLRREYAERKGQVLRDIRLSAEIRMDEAAQAILEELSKILGEV